MRVPEEHSIEISEAHSFVGMPGKVTEKDVSAVKDELRRITVKFDAVPLLRRLLELELFIFIVAEDQINRMRPFPAQCVESAVTGHIAHEEKVGALVLLSSMKSLQEMGSVVVNIRKKSDKHKWFSTFFP